MIRESFASFINDNIMSKTDQFILDLNKREKTFRTPSLALLKEFPLEKRFLIFTLIHNRAQKRLSGIRLTTLAIQPIL